ncbi:Rieske domain-containing protein [Tachysurus vachellii]|uniref:Rieske domain-containing protein n=1 Tax=Tachysurus vachellii TaxID=175792 RepID=UPI00296B12F1|nr:Rieske domain-containing protein [Tachysurus vachellii]XP_060738351.1 Rieske domain-containing protein [Tachysurus vachellii]XP_060738352.1 Rieske domain-containing protein [Tachysurus vachellii]XP_060738353.1 Rieske domain-containing protein [Tachysurus vachellii]
MSSDEDVSLPIHSNFIGHRDDVIRANRLVTSVNGRDVLVFHHQGELHALDARCYHAGGPLQNGDIEEVAGRVCIVCPWHKYKISVCDGEGVYQAVDPSVKPLKPRWCTKGVKQRVHKVTEIRSRVYITLNTSPEHLESDQYQTPMYRDTLHRNRK